MRSAQGKEDSSPHCRRIVIASGKRRAVAALMKEMALRTSPSMQGDRREKVSGDSEVSKREERQKTFRVGRVDIGRREKKKEK